MADAPEPITVEQARAQVRLGKDTSQDAYLSTLIVAAREFVEGWTGLVLTPREVVEAASLGIYVDLKAWPVRTVTSISYLDAAGASQPIAAGGWYTVPVRRPLRIRPMASGWGVPASWCRNPAPVAITVQAGYETPDDVPASVKQAMLLLVDHWFNNRSAAEVGGSAAAVAMPFGVAPLLRRWRRASI